MHRFSSARFLTVASLAAAALLLIGNLALTPAVLRGAADHILRGASAFTNYRLEKPGTFRQITVADLPQPYATRAVDNGPRLVPRPANAWPQTLPGFKVTRYAEKLSDPREIRVAPNGDLFLAESYPGRILVFRGIDKDGTAGQWSVFASGWRQPFGMAFYPPGPPGPPASGPSGPPDSHPQFLYVGNTDSVVRFPYQTGDLKARGAAQKVMDLPAGGLLRGGGHWTRDLAFSSDGKKLFVAVGSFSNVDDSDNNPREFHRANILEANPDGSDVRVYAWGIRNPVGIAVDPATGELWASVNERDELGDDLPPDYITHLQDGGFYGWPWYYIGGHQDPRHAGKHPELRDKVIVPDVLLQPHNASLELAFYEGRQFPEEYRGDIFAAEHGSWNRALRAGYEVIRVPLKNGQAVGDYEDFVTGFVTANGDVWGRPVGVAVAPDGSLFCSDDFSNSIWRVTYTGK